MLCLPRTHLSRPEYFCEMSKNAQLKRFQNQCIVHWSQRSESSGTGIASFRSIVPNSNQQQKLFLSSRQSRLYYTTPRNNQKSKEGYQSIGSFHSDNVEELIRLPKEEYTPPELPFPKVNHTYIPQQSSKFSALPFANSQNYISSFSHLNRQQWSFLNHGAFGLALDVGLHRANSWRVFLESQPLQYFDRYLLNHLVHGARCMADFVVDDGDDSAIREGMAMISNVTGGMNAVIAGHARCSRDNGGHNKEEKKVFYYDIAYGSNKKMCQTYHGKENAIEIPFEEEFLPLLQKSPSDTNRGENDSNPASTEIFLSALDAKIRNLSKNATSKSSLSGSLLILDQITSNTAIHVPISTIAKYAKEEYDMIVAVDGAHGLLSLPLNMRTILTTRGAKRNKSSETGYVDIYLTNAHKWLSSPRGAALLFCTNPLIRETILRQPAVVSHGVDDGFFSRFLWDGCRDYASQLSLPAIVDFWNQVDVNKVRKEMENNLIEGVRILISHWHPGVCSDKGDSADTACILKNSAEARVTLVPLGMHAPMMALVRLPVKISGGGNDNNPSSATTTTRKTSTHAKKVQDFLYSQNVEVPVKCIRGVLYVRISCHVYNTVEEFETLGRIALKYVEF